MRLDGSLEDFGLPDILELLAKTEKSGALHLHAIEAQRRGVIRLGAGAIDGACSDLRRQVLARRLVGAGLVSDDALAGAADDVRAGAPSLLRALLERGALPAGDVARVAAEQATDAVCELLRWSVGTFSFMVGELDPDGLTLALRADKIVAEGQRRMQVWPMLISQIPSPDTVLRLATAPNFDPSCTREEWGLLALVDGNRSVNEIVALLGRSEFALAGALAALVERGLLTVDATGSGLADLQRRQAIIAGLEMGEGESEPEMRAPADTAAQTRAAPQAPGAAVEVPLARSTGSDISMHGGTVEVPLARSPGSDSSRYSSTHSSTDSSSYVNVGGDSHLRSPAVQSSVPVSALAYDRPMTDGSAALATAPAVAEPLRDSREPVARGLDSAVTKSLLLRLIAGVRGL